MFYTDDLLSVVVILYLASLVINIIVGLKFQDIAQMKGHDGRGYFWWVLFLGPIGMLMVIALPDRNIAHFHDDKKDDELPDL